MYLLFYVYDYQITHTSLITYYNHITNGRHSSPYPTGLRYNDRSCYYPQVSFEVVHCNKAIPTPRYRLNHCSITRGGEAFTGMCPTYCTTLVILYRVSVYLQHTIIISNRFTGVDNTLFSDFLAVLYDF